jgi:hypothetical protein
LRLGKSVGVGNNPGRISFKSIFCKCIDLVDAITFHDVFTNIFKLTTNLNSSDFCDRLIAVLVQS